MLKPIVAAQWRTCSSLVTLTFKYWLRKSRRLLMWAASERLKGRLSHLLGPLMPETHTHCSCKQKIPPFWATTRLQTAMFMSLFATFTLISLNIHNLYQLLAPATYTCKLPQPHTCDFLELSPQLRMLLQSLLKRHELAVPSLDQPILDLPRVTARLVPGQVLQQPVTMVKHHARHTVPQPLN